MKDTIWIEKYYAGKSWKTWKRGLTSRILLCYIMTVAPMRAARNCKEPWSLTRCRMYPENYTMQNMLEETLTARCNIVDVSQRTQFFYKKLTSHEMALPEGNEMRRSCSGWSRFYDLSRRQTGRVAESYVEDLPTQTEWKRCPRWVTEWIEFPY